MPLLCFDLIQGRSEKQIDMILDVTHEVLVKSFNVPQRDRYQIVREHAPSRMIVEDTGLGSLIDRFLDHLSQVFRLRFLHAGTICRGLFPRLGWILPPGDLD